MTFNGSWGWFPTPPEDWRSTRDVINMLRQVTAGGGNLLLNIGPKPDGSVPETAVERLTPVGKWLEKYGEAIYGQVTRCDQLGEWMPTGQWTLKGRTGYFHVNRGWGSEIAIGGLKTKVKRAQLLGGKRLSVDQQGNRLVLKGLPPTCPDRNAEIGVIKVEFAGTPKQVLGAGCVVLK